jgi:hypothetical protein
MEKIAEQFNKLKRSRTPHKDRVTSLFNRLNQLSKLEIVMEDKPSGLMEDLDFQVERKWLRLPWTFQNVQSDSNV